MVPQMTKKSFVGEFKGALDRFFEKKYGKYQKFYEEFHELTENFVR